MKLKMIFLGVLLITNLNMVASDDVYYFVNENKTFNSGTWYKTRKTRAQIEDGKITNHENNKNRANEFSLEVSWQRNPPLDSKRFDTFVSIYKKFHPVVFDYSDDKTMNPYIEIIEYKTYTEDEMKKILNDASKFITVQKRARKMFAGKDKWRFSTPALIFSLLVAAAVGSGCTWLMTSKSNQD